MRIKTETELAKLVVDALSTMGWEIYQEVEGPGGRCDIVAVRGKIQWAIECKLSLGLPVMGQAHNWIRYNRGHYVSVATPSYPSDSSMTHQMLKHYGIGALCVTGEEKVREIIKPRLNRKAKPFNLHEEQKTFCDAGSNQGGHWTPFKQTVKCLVAAVKTSPGIEFNELIKKLDHHYSSYSSAKSCLRGFIGTDVIPNLRVEMVGRKLCVFMKEAQS